jgi:hypothetical protein
MTHFDLTNELPEAEIEKAFARLAVAGGSTV